MAIFHYLRVKKWGEVVNVNFTIWAASRGCGIIIIISRNNCCCGGGGGSKVLYGGGRVWSAGCGEGQEDRRGVKEEEELEEDGEEKP